MPLPGGSSGAAASSQSFWSDLAGRNAAAFQRVSALLQQQAQQGEAAAPAGGGGSSPSHPKAEEPHMERQRQLAWMLFLLACKTAEHRCGWGVKGAGELSGGPPAGPAGGWGTRPSLG